MIIPAEAAGPYANASRRFAEERKPLPVDGLGGMQEDFPGSLPGQGSNARAQRIAEPRGDYEPERRQGDRRQTNTPMMLDTRATRSRRQTALPSPIDVRI